MVTICLLVVITIIIIIVDKSGDAHIMVRTMMGKVMTISACNVLIKTSVVSSGVRGSNGSITISIGVLLCYSVGFLTFISR